MVCLCDNFVALTELECSAATLAMRIIRNAAIVRAGGLAQYQRAANLPLKGYPFGRQRKASVKAAQQSFIDRYSELAARELPLSDNDYPTIGIANLINRLRMVGDNERTAIDHGAVFALACLGLEQDDFTDCQQRPDDALRSDRRHRGELSFQ